MKLTLLALLFCANLAGLQAQKTKMPYAVILSFHSIVTGVPSAAPIEKYVQNFKKANAIKKVSADKVGPFGREGEYRLCFTLKCIPAKKRQQFIAGLQKVVSEIPGPGSVAFEDAKSAEANNFESRIPQKITY